LAPHFVCELDVEMGFKREAVCFMLFASSAGEPPLLDCFLVKELQLQKKQSSPEVVCS